MRICGVIASLGPGGSERVMATLVAEWARAGNQVALVTLANASEDFFDIGEAVQRIGIDLQKESKSPVSAISNNAKRIRKLRRSIIGTSPDVVVSFGDRTNVLTLLATIGLPLPVVISERSHPEANWPGLVWALFRKAVYPRAAKVVAQTKKAAAWLECLVGPHRITVIPNPLSPEFLADRPTRKRQPLVVGLGRLTPEKGFDLLIAAFSRVAQENKGWTLELYGEGSEEPLIRQLGAEFLDAQIEIRPPTRDPVEVLDRATIFVLPSLHEGFPNALVEAMARGCAVVASDCDWGPREIVTDGVDGLLVPPGDLYCLAAAIELLIQDPDLCQSLGSAGTSGRSRFEASAIANGWLSVLAEAAKSTGN